MKPINYNKKPVEVDFNNMESDGAVRLHLPVTKAMLESMNIKLKEGMILWVTDGELEVKGIVTLRDDMWVLKVNDGDYHKFNEVLPFPNEKA